MDIRHLGIAVLFLTVPFVVSASPTAAEYGTVLNLSGKQRMLTQKMTKEIMLIALDVEKERNLENLESTSALFDKTLIGLGDGDESLGLPPTDSKRISRQLGKVSEIWKGFQPIVDTVLSSQVVSEAQISTVASQNLPLLKEMNRCVKLYERDASKAGLKSNPGLAVSINLAGKQRMLTQKMSKEFLLICLGHEPEQNRLNLLQTSTLFDRTLKGLIVGDDTLGLPSTEAPVIVEQLEQVRSLWEAFFPIVERATSGSAISKADIVALAQANLPLLKEINKAVGMYEKKAVSE